MMKKDSVKRIVKNVALILLGVLISAALLASNTVGGAALPQGAGAAAQGAVPEVQLGSFAASSPDAVWTNCTPANVASYTTRVHVKCTASVGGIWYFAVATDNPAHVARILSVLSTAKVAGRTLSILYEPGSTSDLPPGCAASDCRTLLAAAIL